MCKGIAKIILVVFNLIFLLAGLLMLTFGIVAHVKPDSIIMMLAKLPGISEVSDAFDLGGIIQGTAIFMIILGAVVAAVAFFGCCGACCESRGLLIAYIVVLVVVLLAEVTLIIFAAVAPEKLKGTIQDVMQKSMSKFKEDVTLYRNGTFKLPNDPISLGWTFLQFGANCCGTYNYTDYSKWPHNVTIDGETRSAAVPISCCAKTKDINLESSKSHEDSAFKDLSACLAGNNDYINQKNCYDSIFDIILRSRIIAIGIASGISAVVVLLIILANVLASQNNKIELS